jgi:PIN domain nuclease of toxin-antitoxin system
MPARSGALLLHKDHFDRLLAAQAALEPLILVTNDRMLEGYGSFVSLLWPAISPWSSAID